MRVITIYMLIKAVRLNEITMGVSIDKEKVQGLSTIAFRGQGDEEEAAKKMEKEWPGKSEENLKNGVYWKPSEEVSSRKRGVNGAKGW